MRPTQLEIVFPEIFEIILDNLDLDTIKSLRLTSKALGNRCIGPRFNRFVENQETDLTFQSLDGLFDLASYPVLSQAVKHVTITATVFDTTELESKLQTRHKVVVERNGYIYSKKTIKCTEDDLTEAQTDLDWLREKIDLREKEDTASVTASLSRVLRQFGKLRTLKIDALVLKGKDKRILPSAFQEWSPVFIRASEVYRIATSAVAQSKVNLEYLTVYRFVSKCGVPSFDITAHMETLESEGFAEAGAQIKNFALQFSTRTETDIAKIRAEREQLQGADRAFHDAMGSTTGLYKAEATEATTEENFPGIARLLKQMPNLEALDLHLRNTLRGSANRYFRIFTIIADEVRFVSLEQCFIRGLYATEASLLRFLGNHPKLNHIELLDVRLIEGSWDPVLKQLTQMPSLTRLLLSNLFGGGYDVMNLSPGGLTKETMTEWQQRGWIYPCDGGPKIHTREFTREEIEQGLDFPNQDIGQYVGSPQFVRWVDKRTAEYLL